jgi:hypothetical protein
VRHGKGRKTFVELRPQGRWVVEGTYEVTSSRLASRKRRMLGSDSLR